MFSHEHLARGGLLPGQLRERARDARDEHALWQADGRPVADAKEVRDVADAVHFDALVVDAHGDEPGEDLRQVADDVEPLQVHFGLDPDARAAVCGEGREVAEVWMPCEPVPRGKATFLVFGHGIGRRDVGRRRPLCGNRVGVPLPERLVGEVSEDGDLAAAERIGAEEVGVCAVGLPFRRSAGTPLGAGAHFGSFPSASGASASSSSRRRWISAARSYFCRRTAFFSSRWR